MARKVLMISQDVDGCIFSTDKDHDPREIALRNHKLIAFIVRKSQELGATHVVFVNGSARQTKYIDKFNMDLDPQNKTLPVFEGIKVICDAVARALPRVTVSLSRVTLADALLETEVGLGFAQVDYSLPGAYQELKYYQVYLAAHHLARQHMEDDPETDFFTMHVDDKRLILDDLADRAADFPRGKFFGVSYPQYRGEMFMSRDLMFREQASSAPINPAPFRAVKTAITQELAEVEQAAKVSRSPSFRY